MSFDLDITNYKLQDILNLFNLTLDFNEDDLKKAKKITLKTHPDKSKLPKEYFLFYSKAYKKLYHIYSFRKNSGKKFEIEYSELINEDETLKEAFTLINKNKNENFNRWFNKTFDELNKTETHGYSEWLSNENSEISEKIKKSKSNKEKEDIIKEQKTKNRELTIYKDIEDTYAVSSVSSCNLSKNKPDYYGNGELFGYCIATVVMMGPIFFLFALILLKITDLIIPLRVTSEVEKTGLDISHHGETLPGVEMKQTKDTNFSVVPVNDASENI